MVCKVFGVTQWIFVLQDEGGHHRVPVLILGVQQHQHQVKSTQQGTGQSDIHTQRLQRKQRSLSEAQHIHVRDRFTLWLQSKHCSLSEAQHIVTYMSDQVNKGLARATFTHSQPCSHSKTVKYRSFLEWSRTHTCQTSSTMDWPEPHSYKRCQDDGKRERMPRTMVGLRLRRSISRKDMLTLSHFPIGCGLHFWYYCWFIISRVTPNVMLLECALLVASCLRPFDPFMPVKLKLKAVF